MSLYRFLAVAAVSAFCLLASTSLWILLTVA